MDLELRDKTIFITGASSGIGAVAAEIFSGELLHDRRNGGCQRGARITLARVSRSL